MRRARSFYFIKNQHGLSLIESMVSVAILVTVALGVISSINYYQTRMVLGNTQNSLEKIRGDILDRLQNDRSWRETVVNTADLQCVEDMADCQGVAADFPIEVRNDDGTLYADAATRFNSNGNICDPVDIANLDAVTLNLRCPIQFRIEGNFNCPGGVPCFPTSVDIVAIPTVADEFSQVYGQLATGQANVAAGACKYCLTFNRGLATRQQTFSYISRVGPNPGACGANVWTMRNLNTLVDDQEAVATLDGLGELDLPQGRYKCRAEATAYNVGSFRIAPFVDGAQLGTASGSGFTAALSGSKAFVEFEVRQNAAFKLGIRQLCSRSVSACDFGFDALCGLGDYARLDCTRIF